ncbi:unknown [Odoribacter splanchnicus CAG:14]|nr:unknown [Odoribacter splanchnicus CAG:14]
MLSERFVVTQLVSPNVVFVGIFAAADNASRRDVLIFQHITAQIVVGIVIHHLAHIVRLLIVVLPGIGDILFILELGIKNKFAPDFGIQPDVKTVSGGFRRIFPVAHLAQHIVGKILVRQVLQVQIFCNQPVPRPHVVGIAPVLFQQQFIRSQITKFSDRNTTGFRFFPLKRTSYTRRQPRCEFIGIIKVYHKTFIAAFDGSFIVLFIHQRSIGCIFFRTARKVDIVLLQCLCLHQMLLQLAPIVRPPQTVKICVHLRLGHSVILVGIIIFLRNGQTACNAGRRRCEFRKEPSVFYSHEFIIHRRFAISLR